MRIKIMNKDKIGIFLSLGCLIHCVLGPLILPILPLFGLTIEHEAQLLNYLKATGIKVGILVNFKKEKAEVKRMVLDLKE